MANIWYWGVVYIALCLCITYHYITAHKYGIKRWKLIMVMILSFVFNWVVSYISAWVEAGFTLPPSINIVRGWVFCPIFFFLCSILLNINFRRVCDAMTPCCILGFAIGKIGCAIVGCCHGYPYDGLFALWSNKVGYYCFPIQIIETIASLILFTGFVIYVIKSKFKITGRQYPLMLMFYTFRVFFEFLRDNPKVLWKFSALSFHALFGGLVGLIWFYLTSAHGKRFIAMIRKSIFKKDIKVQSLEQYRKQIKDMEQSLSSYSYLNSDKNYGIKIIKISKNEFNDERKKTFTEMNICLLISFFIILVCISWLNMKFDSNMGIFFVIFFIIICIFVIYYSMNTIIRVARCRHDIDNKDICFFVNPITHKLFMTNKHKCYHVVPENCPQCGLKDELDLLSKNRVKCSCLTSKRHSIIIDNNYIKTINSNQ